MTNFRIRLKNVATVFACFAVAVLISATLMGCKKDKDDPKPEPQPEPTERIAVNLRADILPASATKSSIVPHVANDQWEANDKVGVFMKRAGQALTAQGAIFGDANNLQMSIENGTLTASPPLMYPTSGNVDFIAYYPYNANVGANFTIPVNLAEQAEGLPVEVLYSNDVTNRAPTASPVTLNFLYSLAKIELTVTGGENSDKLTADDFAAMTVTVEGLYTQATLQLANGTFTGAQEKQPVTLHRKSSNATSATFEMLALPSNEQVTFLFNDRGVVHRHDMTVDYAGARLYKYTFALDYPEATLLNTYIVPREEELAQNISVGAGATGFWTRKDDFVGLAAYGRGVAVGFSIENKGYVGTGFDGLGWRLQDFWEYDPVSDVWTQKASFAGGNRRYAVGFTIGNKGYVGTGTAMVIGGGESDFWEYDPVENIWSPKANFSGGNRFGAIGFSVGNKGYIGTGMYENDTLQDFWEYDPVSDEWTRKADFEGGARYSAIGFSIGNKGYVGTGNDGSQRLQDFWEYDPVSDEWTRKADFEGGNRSDAIGFSIGNKGYVGTGGGIGDAKEDFWEYDPISAVWTRKANFAGGARSGTIGFSVGNKGYVGNGVDNINWRQDFWEFTP